MRNQTSFRLTTTLLPTDTTAKTTTVINKVDSSGNKFYPTFSEETVVITNDDRTIMETTRATCTDWVLTFIKRGLSDDNTATEVANRKLTWNPWSLAFITAWASDWIDIDDDLTWTWDQTYTGKATYQGQLITQKWVKYPNFATVDALNAYTSPFAWMFATVDATGELYRYNAKTEQWDMVSSTELSDYIIRADDEKPAQWTANNIITLVDNDEAGEIYLWDKLIATGGYYVDAVVVWWGGGWAACGNYAWWGGWAVVYREWASIWASSCVVVWSWGTTWCVGGVSSLWKIIAWGGWAWGVSYPQCCNGSSWGGAYLNNVCGYNKYQYKWMYWNIGAECHCSQSWQTISRYYWNGGWAGWEPEAPTTRWWLPKKVEFNNWLSEAYSWGWGGAYSYGGGSSSGCSNWNCYNLCWSWGQWIYNWAGCTGKDWVVQIMYPADWSYGFQCASGGNCCYCCNGYCVHRFTSSWTFTVCY